MAELIVTVEFCGGPLEGVIRQLPFAALLPRWTVPVYPRNAVSALLASKDASRAPVVRHAEYVLHKYGTRYEYVHDGTN